MTSDEFKDEILTQSKNLKDVPDKILEQLNKSILILTKLNVKKVFIEYDKYEECIVIWLNLYNKIVVNINIYEDPLCTFSIFCDGNLLVVNELDLVELIERLKRIQNKLKMKNTLLIIDPQVDFISGTLAVPNATHAMNNLVKFIKEHDINNFDITLDSHPSNHSSFKKFGGIWPEHCVKYTDGWLIYEPLINSFKKPFNIFYKGENESFDEYSIFSKGNKYGKLLTEDLKSSEVIYVAGLAGDYCVMNTLKDLEKLGFKDKIIVLKDCVASIVDEVFTKFIKSWQTI